MRSTILVLVCVFGFSSISCGASTQIATSEGTMNHETDSVVIKTIAKFKIDSDKIFNSPDDYPISAVIYQDSLFMLFYSNNKLISMSIKTGRANTSNTVNTTIAKHALKYNGLKEMVVTNNYYYISCLTAVVAINRKTHKVVVEIPSSVGIEHISVDSNNNIILFTANEITYYNENGQRLFNVKAPSLFTPRFINNPNGDVIIGNGLEVLVYNIYNRKFMDLKIALNTIPLKQVFLGSSLDDRFYYFRYDTRNMIYEVNKINSKIETTYDVSTLGLKPTTQEIQDEEGNPNLLILPDKDNRTFYIIGLKGNNLSVYKISN